MKKPVPRGIGFLHFVQGFCAYDGAKDPAVAQ